MVSALTRMVRCDACRERVLDTLTSTDFPWQELPGTNHLRQRMGIEVFQCALGRLLGLLGGVGAVLGLVGGVGHLSGTLSIGGRWPPVLVAFWHWRCGPALGPWSARSGGKLFRRERQRARE